MHISELSLSDDAFHHDKQDDNPAKLAYKAAVKLGIPVDSICIAEPSVEKGTGDERDKGEPVIGGNVVFKGRAVDKLTEGLPQKHWREFTECPFEDLENPGRVHLDSFGNVHLCQGLSMGNMWEIPLSSLVKNYNAQSHPICGPLVKGGPALLAKKYNVKHEDKFVSECHFCYIVRRNLIDRFPQLLTPRQVFGLE